jgi:cation diffusion facilitator CzcD-associated flavoprotein CzcO/predicted ATP-grasp superfamily ATP-dependent carboligase
MRGARILVTDGETRAVVAVARGLVEAGFAVSVAANVRVPLAAAQLVRSVSERLVTPDPLRAPTAFVAALEGAVSDGTVSVLIPGGDASLLAISDGRARLEPHVRLGLPDPVQVRRSLDKANLSILAARHGLDPPSTLEFLDSAQALDAARELGYPVLVKPLSSISERVAPRHRVSSAWVEDDAELRRAIAQFGGAGLVQQRVEGDLMSFAGVLAGGRLLAEAVSRYHRTWPANGGNASYSETIEAPSALRRRVVALLQDLGWEGIFELELIEAAPDRWHAIDLNPRPYGSIALAIAAGANLPAVWSEYLSGDDPGEVRAAAGVFYRWTDADLRHGLSQLRAGRLGAAAQVLRVRRGVVHPYARGSDRGPGVARLLELGGLTLGRGPRGRRARHRRRELPTVIVGAGPNGLAVAAHLREAGIDIRCFGEPLEAWSEHMPTGMLLRSRRRSSHIADPRQELTIDHYELAEGRPVSRPTITREEFVDYGRWFQRRAVPDLDTRKVTEVAHEDGTFQVTVDGSERVLASRVVVAAGLSPFPNIPEPFAALPAPVRSHAYDHADLGSFRGLRTAVIGSGQSALESAALLHEAGASVEVLARSPSVYWLGDEPADGVGGKAPATPRIGRTPPPTDVGGRATGWIAAAPDVFRRMPERLQPVISFRCIRPAGAGWLRPRLSEVPMSFGRSVVAASVRDGAVELSLDDGSTRTVDRVLLGTGYRIDVHRYPFLGADLIGALDMADGYPVLSAGLESSVPGLHFMGAPAAHSFGPIMRFVVGSWYSAPAVARRAAERRQPPVSFAYPRPARPA